MPVDDIQTWVNNADAYRFPLLESDVADLQRDVQDNTTLLNQKIQEFQDQLDAHTIQLGVHSADIAEAQSKANQALTAQNQLLLDAKAYADAKFQELQNQINNTGTDLEDYITQNLYPFVEERVATNLPSLLNQLDNALQIAATSEAALDVKIANYELATQEILDNLLPQFDVIQTQVSTDVQDLQTEVETLLTDYSFISLKSGFDDIRAANEASIAPLAPGILRIPESLWTSNTNLSTSTLAKPAVSTAGIFLTDDPDFGECFEFTGSGNSTIGPAYPFDFDPARVYKITTVMKVVDDNSGAGVSCRLLVTTQKGAVQKQVNQSQSISPNPATIADGIIENSCYVGTDAGILTTYGIPVQNQLILAAGDGSNKIYTAVRQNQSASTAGRIIVASIHVRDVTEVLGTYQTIKNELTAAIGSVNADLAENYYTITGTDTAIAAKTLELQTAMEGPTGSVGLIQSDLSTNYYTVVDVDNAISAMETDLRAEFNTYTTMLSEGDFSNGSGDWDPANHTIVTSTTPALPPTITHALRMDDQILYDGAMRSEAGMEDRVLKAVGWVLTENSSYDAKIGVETLRADGTTYDLTFVTVRTAGAVGWSQFTTDIALPSDVIAWRPALGTSDTTNSATQDVFWANLSLRDVSGVSQNTAAIEAESIARANADSALAADILTLTSDVDDVNALLTAEYYTKAEADAAIAAEVTTLETSIGDVESDLTTNYYTKVEVDEQADSAWEAAAAASTSEINAATSAGNASASQIAAATSETNAAGSATFAGVKADLAADSETAAAGSAGAAASSATAAETSATDAGISAEAAETYSISAETSAVASSKSLAVLGPSVLSVPATAWTNRSQYAETSLTKDAVTNGTFVTDDPVFGDAYEFVPLVNSTVGPAYPANWTDRTVLEVRTRVRAEGAPADIAPMRIGVTLQSGTTLNTSNAQNATDSIAVADGEVERVIWFTIRGSASMPITLPDYVDELVTITNGSAPGSNKAYAHVRQGVFNDELGQLVVGTIEVRDVTFLADAIMAEESAGGAASAAVESAAVASAAQTDAEESALAAASSAVTAGTSAGGAQASQIAAVSSATDAAGHASDALISATAAAQSLESFKLSHTDTQRVLDKIEAVDSVGALESISLGNPVLGQAGTVISRTSAGTIDTSGETNGLIIEIPVEQALQYSGRRIRVDILARQAAINPATEFIAAYSTNDVGNSGQSTFIVDLDWEWHSFYYDVPAASSGGTDYIGLWGDSGQSNNGTEFARVLVRLVPESGDIEDIALLQAEAVTAAQAITDLEGNAAASLVFRTKAGGAVGSVEIVSLDQAGDEEAPTSIIKLSSDTVQIDADTVLIGDFENLLYGSTGLWVNHGWLFDTGATIDNWASAKSAETVLRLTEAHSQSFFKKEYDVLPGDQYRLNFWVRPATNVVGQTNGVNRIQIETQDATGAWTHLHGDNWESDTLGIWTNHDSSFVIPAGAVKMRISIDTGHTSGDVRLDDVRLRKKFGAELIVDGGLSSFDWVPGVTGWHVDPLGNAEFNQLIVRNSLVPGSASDFANYFNASALYVDTFPEFPVGDTRLFSIGVSEELQAAYGVNTIEIGINIREWVDGAWTPWRGAGVRPAFNISTSFTRVRNAVLTFIEGEKFEVEIAHYRTSGSATTTVQNQRVEIRGVAR